MMSAKRPICAVLSMCGLLPLGACAPGPDPSGPSRPAVILISFDTCRADVFGVLTGESPSLTPRLDELAADSVVFENAFVQAPHTLPSHMSMLTAVYPDVHGVKPDEDPLPESLVTLPQILQEAGYRTVGLVTSEWLKPDFGFGRGFDEYERLPHRRTYAERVNATALWELRRGRAPHFLFLHYYDLHSDFDDRFSQDKFPYYSPPRYREGLGVSSDGREFCDAKGNCNTGYLLAAAQDGRKLPQTEIDTIHGLYRAAVPHLDSEMGDFFDELRSRGMYEGSLIIVTSDHGEEFHEHGRFIHSQPYDETIAVPLFIKFPGSWAAGTRVEEVVETVDILPTVLDYLGIDPLESAQGESLLGLVGGPEGGTKRATLSQDTVIKTRYGLRTDQVKLIMDLKAPRRELYDLREDPHEKVDVAGERAELADELERRLKSLVAANRRLHEAFATGEGVDRDPLSAEERKRLESLGYVN
jgi:arylsulfatase A-like enzyme